MACTNLWADLIIIFSHKRKIYFSYKISIMSSWIICEMDHQYWSCFSNYLILQTIPIHNVGDKQVKLLYLSTIIAQNPLTSITMTNSQYFLTIFSESLTSNFTNYVYVEHKQVICFICQKSTTAQGLSISITTSNYQYSTMIFSKSLITDMPKLTC